MLKSSMRPEGMDQITIITTKVNGGWEVSSTFTFLSLSVFVFDEITDTEHIETALYTLALCM